MPERITCKCGKVLVVPDRAAGPLGLCPVCKAELLLPGHEPPASAAAPNESSLHQVRAALETLRTLLPDEPAPARPARRWSLWLLGGVALVGLLALSFWLAGTESWSWVAGISALVLIIFGVGITRAEAWREVGLLYFGCLLVWGAWVGVGHTFRPTRIDIRPDSDLEKAEGPHVPIRIFYAGREVSSFSDGTKQTFEARLYRRELVRAQALRPDGWFGCFLESLSRDDSFYVQTGPLVTLYIDNRGGGAVTLASGAVQLDVPADSSQTRTILAPADSPRYPLTINGQPAGELTAAYHLVDVRGTRSYRHQTLTYGDGLAPFFGVRPPADRVKLFGPGRLHALPGKIDFFLTKAPEKIQVKQFLGVPGASEQRTELIEAD
jgi:hypothetical protein